MNVYMINWMSQCLMTYKQMNVDGLMRLWKNLRPISGNI